MSWFTNEKKPGMAIQIVSISMPYSTQKRSSNIWLMHEHVFLLWLFENDAICQSIYDVNKKDTVRWTEFKETSLKKKKGVETLFAKRKKIAKLRSKWHVACSQKNFHCFKCPLMHLFMYIPAVRKVLLFSITKNQIASREISMFQNNI